MKVAQRITKLSKSDSDEFFPETMVNVQLTQRIHNQQPISQSLLHNFYYKVQLQAHDTILLQHILLAYHYTKYRLLTLENLHCFNLSLLPDQNHKFLSHNLHLLTNYKVLYLYA